MYIKIQRKSYTHFLKCDSYILNHLDKGSNIVIFEEGELKARTIYVSPGDEVYTMNEDGKTIDTHWI